MRVVLLGVVLLPCHGLIKGMASALVKAATPELAPGESWDPKKRAKEPHVEPRLLRVCKAKQSAYGEPRLVPMSASSLNHGDCFILDTGTEGRILFIWNGSKSSPFEKASAESIAKKIKEERRDQVVIKMAVDDEAAFWKTLGGKQEVKMEADPLPEVEGSEVKLKIQVRVPRWARLEKPLHVISVTHGQQL